MQCLESLDEEPDEEMGMRDPYDDEGEEMGMRGRMGMRGNMGYRRGRDGMGRYTRY